MLRRIFLIPIIFLLTQNLHAQSEQDFLEDIKRYAETLELPTLAVGVAKEDSLIFYKGVGTASPTTKTPITKEHIFYNFAYAKNKRVLTI